jgi:hypothetical protein
MRTQTLVDIEGLLKGAAWETEVKKGMKPKKMWLTHLIGVSTTIYEPSGKGEVMTATVALAFMTVAEVVKDSKSTSATMHS